MNDEPNEERDALPQSMRSALADIYAPPAHPGYWETLEARILARVRREAALAWWSHFPNFARAGLAAAAAAILLVGLVWFQERRSEQRMAEDRLLQPLIDQDPVLVETMAEDPNSTTRDATLRYVISR